MVEDTSIRKCPICKREMVCYMDTCLCPVCDWEQLWYLAAWTKHDIEDMKKGGKEK